MGNEVRGDGIIDSSTKIPNARSEGLEGQWQPFGIPAQESCIDGSSNTIHSHCEQLQTQSRLGGTFDGTSSGLDENNPWFGNWETEPRTTEIKENRVARIKALGNGVVPLQVRTAFLRLLGF